LWWPEKIGVLSPTNDRVEVPTIMRAFDPEVKDIVWQAIEPLVPVRWTSISRLSSAPQV